ncbi:GntR family transcriptional regulator [Streptomyces sp. URMC 123]|uniref:GntR family transcriptional regulator n=1 Tax=Streptomyces sp. URMC 123 TaxID=3423403 RepID=UPI003F1A5065
MSHVPFGIDQAYDHVKARLMDGRLDVGSVISEETVAAELDLPRLSVHEAFLRLQAEGYLRLYPKRGALVLPVTLDEARAVMEARLLLEVFALDSVAARGRTALRTLGEELIADIRDVETPQDALEDARAFHTRLVRSAGNHVVSAMFTTLWEWQVRIAAASTTGPGYAARDTAEHTEIAQALIRGRGGQARQLLHAHMSEVLRRLGVGDDFALPRPADL